MPSCTKLCDCCTKLPERCRKTFLFFAYAVATAGSVAYCFYLIWLLAYLKDDANYWFFGFFPGLCIIMLLGAVIAWLDKDRFTRIFRVISLMVFTKKEPNAAQRKILGNRHQRVLYALIGFFYFVIILVMCLFTMLTRQAYYHLSEDSFIGPNWVINSLKGSIIFIVCGFLIAKECRLEKILEGKDDLSRALLDFVDIFNMVEVLSLNECVGIGSTVTEESPLEMAIQAFCTVSLYMQVYFLFSSTDLPLEETHPSVFGFIFRHIEQLLRRCTKADETHSSGIAVQYSRVFYYFSIIAQNLPFLVIRIIVWAKYNVFSLGFMVKNAMAIVICCAEIHKSFMEQDNKNSKTEPPSGVHRNQEINDNPNIELPSRVNPALNRNDEER